MAIEGIQPVDELVELYSAFCDPADGGVQLIHDMAYDLRPLLLDDAEEPIAVSLDMWRVFRFFRLHLGMAIASEPRALSEWYYNPVEGLRRMNYNVNAHYASELYLRLKVCCSFISYATFPDGQQLWESSSSTASPALVDELQALVAMINGLQESNSQSLHLLKAQVSRRELELVYQYLREHPQVQLTRKLRDELRGLPSPDGAPRSTLAELAELRATQQ